MFSLLLRCPEDHAELVAAELWDSGATALSEIPSGDCVIFEAGFEHENRSFLLRRFALYKPQWQRDDTDWIVETQRSWPAREIGSKIFLAPPWNRDATPGGRIRLIQNPGMASGTGEHPCTQLALEALERCVQRGSNVLDVGTGSGILAIAAALLGARTTLALDPDVGALQTAKSNFLLNRLSASLAAASAEAVKDEWADVTVANINGSVLLAIVDELLRVTSRDGVLILTGFSEDEAGAFVSLFPCARLTTRDRWACVTIMSASTASS